MTAAHPKGLALVTIDDRTYAVNRFGVVFEPSTPDPHFPGWHNVNFCSDRAVLDRIRDLVRPAFKRTAGMELIYDVREMRRLADASVQANRVSP